MRNKAEERYNLYKTLQEIERIIKEEGQKEDLLALNIRYVKYSNDTNPFYGQTSSGLILSYHSNPQRFHGGDTGPYIADTHYYDINTPWGYSRSWFTYNAFSTNREVNEFLDGSNWDYYKSKYDEAINTLTAIRNRVLKRLGGVALPDDNRKLYALHRVDEIQLPEPKMRLKVFYRNYETCHVAWESLTVRYKAENAK